MDSFVTFFFRLAVLITLDAQLSYSATVFNFRLLRNAGLQNASNAVSLDDCASKCIGACSAVSYQFSSGKCLLSYCNQLDLVLSLEWNTKILSK